jgi:hypothetical protein
MWHPTQYHTNYHVVFVSFSYCAGGRYQQYYDTFNNGLLQHLKSMNMKCFFFMVVILMVNDTLERVGDSWLLTVICYAFL